MKHDYLKVIYVLRGAGTLHWDGEPLSCRSGDILVMPIGQTHRIHDTPAAPLTLYIVCIAGWLLEHDASLTRDLPAGRIVTDAMLSETVRSTLRRMLYEYATGQHGYKSMLQGLTLQLLAQIARQVTAAGAQARSPDCRTLVRRYIQQLNENFFEASDLDTIARQLGMSRRRFTHLFRDLTGESWLNYLQRHRIRHAKHLLATTDRTTLAIAFECGFNDLSTFYRAFQRHEREAPQAWRIAEQLRMQSGDAADPADQPNP